MTPGNSGASTPEDDDPFGYLYADGQANGAQPPTGGYGYPGSVNRVRAVGERQYGQQQAPAGYGQVPQQGYGQQPNPHYAAPEAAPGGAPQSRQSPPGGGRGRGPNTKGLLIGALAVVAAVVIGISIAMMNGDSKDDDTAGNQPSAGASASQSAEPDPSGGDKAPQELPKSDAQLLSLSPDMSTSKEVPGAQSEGGLYVVGLNQPGAQVTWTLNKIPKSGDYTVFVRYGVPGEDAKTTLTVNGTEVGRKLNMANFAHAEQGDWEHGWANTYAWISLNEGKNTISLSCQDGDQCNAYLDQFSLKAGKVTG
ncbi:carbohydrate-binding protein [Streptomyces nodosus]|uniref:carbohydrate-binding protein n=1 Tax=Streptomyces nodosus TaxID=40318 RepID=UPI00345111F3